MTGPRYPRETFAPPESTFPSGGDEPNGSGHAPNGAPEDNVEETRPRAFGVPGTGPAGGFEPRPFAPPHPSEPAPPGGPDGFSEPTLAGGPMNGPDGPPAGPNEQGFGDMPTGYAAPSVGDAPTSYTEGPNFPEGPSYADVPTSFADTSHFSDAPTGYAQPPGGFGDRPGLGDRPPSFDHGPSGPGGGFGDPTMGIAGPTGGGPGGGMAPPMGPPMGVGAPGPVRPRGQQRARGPRRAKLQLRHINPWTVLKFSCVLSVALFFVWLITIGLLYGILQAAGVIDQINNAVTTINGSGSKNPISPGLVFGGSAILGVINVVLFIALSTVGSVVYNLCADLVGGIEVTLSERE
jgi:transmembrane protein DUF3566